MLNIPAAILFLLFVAVLVQKCGITFPESVPLTLDWNDRRPIGAIYLARDNTKSALNPRGWFNDPKIDVFSMGGRKVSRHD